MSMRLYLYLPDSQPPVRGPFGVEQLAELATGGAISPSTLAALPGGTEWQSLAELPNAPLAEIFDEKTLLLALLNAWWLFLPFNVVMLAFSVAGSMVTMVGLTWVLFFIGDPY